MGNTYFVYILSSISRVLYIGVTNDLPRRIWEHKQGMADGFTKKYKIHCLIYYETYPSIIDAISREKQLKKWRREKKCMLIEKSNPGWHELTL